MATEEAPARTEIVRFGIFDAYLGLGELYCEGEKVPLQEKPFLALIALLAQPGALVTRAELHRRLWPDDDFLDFDDSLNTAVQKLRQALGDSASAPRFVETVPRHGYRYVGPEPKRVELTAGSRPTGLSGARALVRPLALALAVAAVIAAIAFFWGRRVGRTDTGVRLGHTTPLSTAPGLEGRPTWSPDGTRVAYASDQLGQMDIWVSQVTHVEPVVLTREHSGYDGNPVWSPDGRWIAFASDRLGGGLFTMSPLGGNPRRVAEVQFVPSVEFVGSVPTLSWAPDSERIVWAHGIGDERSLWILHLSGGEVESVPLAPDFATFSVVEPAWSPDGLRLAFVELGGVARTVSRLWTIRLDGSGLEALTDGTHFDRQPVWSEDGGRIFFLSERAGSLDLWSVALDSNARPVRAPEPVTSGVGIGSFALAPDGASVAYSRLIEQSSLWVWRRGSETPRALAEAAGSQIIESVDVSADGQWLVFDSNRSGNTDIWRMRTDGSQLERLTRHAADDWSPSFSPDATEVAFHSVRDGDRELYVQPVAGGAARRLTEHPATDWLARWSPDGELIAFCSDRTGDSEIWIVPAGGGEPRQLTDHAANDHNPIWSPDGGEILFASNRNGQTELFTVPRAGGEPRRFSELGWLDAVPFEWRADQTVLVWVREAGEARQPGFREVEPIAGRPLPLRLPPGRKVSASLAAAGELLYFPLWERAGDLWLAELEGVGRDTAAPSRAVR